jgi:orotidine-5'-phosphate decarboxylase
MNLVVSYSIETIVKRIQDLTSLPIIYDHQKFGTDIPDICAGEILKTLKNAGITAIIAFPQAGVETLHALVDACKEIGLTLMVGGEMTHKGYLVSEGGYIADDSPRKMYIDATRFGVEYFIVPGTKLEKMKIYRDLVKNFVKDPKFLFPGIGKGQGGDIKSAFSAVSPLKSYAIVGRGIYGEKSKKLSAIRLWEKIKL